MWGACHSTECHRYDAPPKPATWTPGLTELGAAVKAVMRGWNKLDRMDCWYAIQPAPINCPSPPGVRGGHTTSNTIGGSMMLALLIFVQTGLIDLLWYLRF